MELLKIPIPKDKFCLIPKEERVLFVLLGHLGNELNVLGKLMGWCHNAPRTSRPEEDARIMQTMFLAKLLAGKLSEGWEALQNRVFRTELSQKFEGLIEEPHRGHLQELKQYFKEEQRGAKSRRADVLYRVRNRFSFHYSVRDIERNVDVAARLPDEFVVYLGNSSANCLYAACDLISNFAMFQALVPADPAKPITSTEPSRGVDCNRVLTPEDLAKALASLLKDLGKVVGLFLSVISGCMWVIISRHLGDDLDALKAEKIRLDSLADRRRFLIPYFVSAHDGVEAGGAT